MQDLTCKIIERQGEKVLVEIENQTLSLSANHFPEDIKPREQFHIYFWNTKTEGYNKNLAKAILEEILNGK